MQIKIICGVFFIILLLSSCSNPNVDSIKTDQALLPYYQEATFTPVWMDENDKDKLMNFHKIPPFQLTNQLGEKVTHEKFANKVYVADFFFTSCPGICPKMTTNMHFLQETFKDDEDVLLVSHSVTPEHDSVPVLQHYAEVKGVLASKWDLLTGDRTEIYNLGRNFYFVEENLGLEKAAEDFLHTENFVLIDQSRHIRGIYNGLNQASIQQLIKDIKVLKQES